MRRSSARAALASAAAVVCLSVHSLVASYMSMRNAPSVADDVEISEGEAYRRVLRSVDDSYGYVVEEDYDAAYAAAFATDDEEQQHPIPEIQPFALEDAIRESSVFYSTFYVVVYDPPSDKFLAFRDVSHNWEPSNKKLMRTLRLSLRLLRKEFPDRFTPDAPELAFAMASGDYPHVKRWKLPYKEGAAPVLMFGSAFAEKEVYPNMVPMPVPHPMHLDCFVVWAEQGRVCGKMTAKGRGEEREWDDLTPQVIWRGTDFGYLPTLQGRPSLSHPHQLRIFPSSTMREGGGSVERADAVRALDEQYDTLIPRWKGAALTARAELDAESGGSEGALPWADMKFTRYIDRGGKSPVRGSRKYAVWEAAGVAVGEDVWSPRLDGYRYHIDLAGGGGTTWTGTLAKLGMPGLLFHHVTPMKDYVHDRLKAWRHYIPVGSDLKDLKSKFDWAEAHPGAARRIAREGAALAGELRTPEGYARMYREDFVEPMRRVVEAYRPVSSVRTDEGGRSWRDVLMSMEDFRLVPIVECTGRSKERACKTLGWDVAKNFHKSMRAPVQ